MKAIIALFGFSFILLILSNNISIANWVEKESNVSQKFNFNSKQDSSVTDYFKSNIKVLTDEKGNNLYNTNSVGPDILTITGQSPGERLGFFVSNAGDVNGDGYSDEIIAASAISKAYIYFGGPVMDNIADVTFSETESFGMPVSTAGDVNGDGFSDVIVGAYFYNGGTGRVYIYYGGANMDNVSDVVLTGEAVNNYFNNCSSAGDVNGDGYSDVIVGAWGADRAYIYYGGSSMNNVADVVMTGEAPNSGFGITVAKAGDVNGDGYSDVIIGAHNYNSQTGRAYIYYGGVSMNNVSDVVLTGENTNDLFYNCASADDVNGDGYSDVIVGANGYNGYMGRAYIYYGGVTMNNIADIILTGEAVENHFGNSVSTAGDINGDSYSDVIVGAWGYNSNSGKTYIYYGGPSMNNSADITMNGEGSDNYFGYSVATAGNVNGDDFPDILIGAYGFNINRGRAYLYLNINSKPELVYPPNNSSSLPQTIKFVWKKLQKSLFYKLSVSTDSLFNNIIINDIILIDTFKTKSGFTENTRYFWRIETKDSSGKNYSSLKYSFKIINNNAVSDSLTITGQSSEGRLGLFVSNAGDVNGDGYSDVIISAGAISKAYIYFGGPDMDNIADVTISEPESGNFGMPVSTAGDVNGDGFSDVIVGAYGYNGGTGRVHIYYGGANMDNVSDIVLTGEAVNNYFNNCSSAGDVNGDGYSDVIVGAWGYSTATGRAYIYYGGSSMNNVADVVMTGEGINSGFGISVANAGDVNGDSYSDVIVGAHAYNAGTGRTYIYYGGASMNNTADVIMTGEVTGDNFYNCSSAGDVNGDGYSDVIVGAHLNNGSRGKAYVYYGGTAMNNIADVTLTGEAAENYFGNSVSTAGDVNGDGYSDVIVGAWGYNINRGKAYIYYGGSSMNNSADTTFTGETTGNYFGYSVSTAGDLNGNVFPDVIIGAYGFNNNTGKAYLYLKLNSKPILTSPVNNSVNNPVTVNFKWFKFIPASYYILNVSSDSTFNSNLISDSISIDTFKTITGLQKDKKYYWRINAKIISGISNYSSTWNFTTEQGIKLSMKILMEGMYFPIFNQMTRKDTVKVYLYQNAPPYNKMDSATSTIDSLSFKGFFKFQYAPMGTYYIGAKHLNSIETWSKSGGVSMTLTDTTFYDFTTSISQAYGNNLKSKGSKFCIFGGNVNGDGIVDGGDLSEADNDSFSGLSGRFLRSDVNGDNIVDAADVSLVDNNSYNSIVRITP